MNSMNVYSEIFECFVLVTMHPSKSSKANKDINSGAGEYFNSADLVLSFKKVNQTNSRKMKVVKIRNGSSADAEAFFELKGQNNVPLIYLAEKNNSGQPKNTTKKAKLKYYEIVLKIITEKNGEEISPAEILNTVFDSLDENIKKKSLQKSITRRLEELTKERKIIRIYDHKSNVTLSYKSGLEKNSNALMAKPNDDDAWLSVSVALSKIASPQKTPHPRT